MCGQEITLLQLRILERSFLFCWCVVKQCDQGEGKEEDLWEETHCKETELHRRGVLLSLQQGKSSGPFWLGFRGAMVQEQCTCGCGLVRGDTQLPIGYIYQTR